MVLRYLRYLFVLHYCKTRQIDQSIHGRKGKAKWWLCASFQIGQIMTHFDNLPQWFFCNISLQRCVPWLRLMLTLTLSMITAEGLQQNKACALAGFKRLLFTLNWDSIVVLWVTLRLWNFLYIRAADVTVGQTEALKGWESDLQRGIIPFFSWQHGAPYGFQHLSGQRMTSKLYFGSKWKEKYHFKDTYLGKLCHNVDIQNPSTQQGRILWSCSHWPHDYGQNNNHNYFTITKRMLFGSCLRSGSGRWHDCTGNTTWHDQG